mgnify:CR=1 FL=1
MKLFKLLLLLNIGIFSGFSQNNNEFYFSYYNLLSTSYYTNFKINETLENTGVGKLIPFTAQTAIGIDMRVNHIDINLDLGVGAMLSKNIKTSSMQSNLGIGYYFDLKNEDYLTLGGNISYHLINLDAYIQKGSIDFLNNTVNNSTSFSMSTMQFMIGPMVKFEDDWYMISIGYDFGIIPMYWKSNNMVIANNYKERMDRIHIDYIIKFWTKTFKIQ